VLAYMVVLDVILRCVNGKIAVIYAEQIIGREETPYTQTSVRAQSTDDLTFPNENPKPVRSIMDPARGYVSQ